MLFWPKPLTTEEEHKRVAWRDDRRMRSRNTDALIMVDILTKFTQVVPLKGKKEPDILGVWRNVLDY